MNIIKIDNSDACMAVIEFDNGGQLDVYLAEEGDPMYELYISHPDRDSNMSPKSLRSYASDYMALAWLMEQFGIEDINPTEDFRDSPAHEYSLTEQQYNWIKSKAYEKDNVKPDGEGSD